MKKNNYFEIIVGTFVLFCAVYFFFNSFRSAKINSNSGYNLFAKFDNANGIEAGSDVKISGVKIGTISQIDLDDQSFRAVASLSIHDNIKLPSDSSAKIVSDGLLGGKYLEISVGADEELFKENDEILFTQSSVNFEELLGKFIFNDKDKTKDKK